VFDLILIWLAYLHLMKNDQLNVLRAGDVWQLSGPAAERFGVVNEFLTHLADRNYSPRTQRAYAFDLMAFGRWLETEGVVLPEVDTDVLLRFLTACREAVLPGRPGGTSSLSLRPFTPPCELMCSTLAVTPRWMAMAVVDRGPVRPPTNSTRSRALSPLDVSSLEPPHAAQRIACGRQTEPSSSLPVSV
jgi:hypothetical protein